VESGRAAALTPYLTFVCHEQSLYDIKWYSVLDTSICALSSCRLLRSLNLLHFLHQPVQIGESDFGRKLREHLLHIQLRRSVVPQCGCWAVDNVGLGHLLAWLRAISGGTRCHLGHQAVPGQCCRRARRRHILRSYVVAGEARVGCLRDPIQGTRLVLLGFLCNGWSLVFAFSPCVGTRRVVAR